MGMGYGHNLGVHGPSAGPAVRPRPKRRSPPKPKKGYCKHCGQNVTPAPGSPMHAEQAAPLPQINSAMAAMQQQGEPDLDDQAGPPGGY